MKFIHAVLILFMLVVSSTSFAQTVADHIYLEDKLKNEAQSLTYDELTERFKNNPSYEPECIPDDSRNYSGRDKEELLILFKDVIKQGPETSHLQIHYKPLRYGFDLQAEISSQEQSHAGLNLLYNFSSSVNCTNAITEGEDVKNCDTFTFSHELEFELPGINTEDYFPTSTKSESWTLHLLKDPNLIIAYVTTDYTAALKSWLGQRKGTAKYSKSMICLFHAIDSDFESIDKEKP